MKLCFFPSYFLPGKLAFHAAILALLTLTSQAQEAPTSVKLDDNLQLMLDRSIIDTFDGQAGLRLGQPVTREVIIKSEQPWDGDAFFISSIYQQDGLYSMLYRGRDAGIGDERPSATYLCLATSEDGLTWDKPNLGLVDFNGSKANNIVAIEGGKAMPFCFTFYDPRPETPANERVKAIDMREGERRAGGEGKGLRAQIMGSADGKVWHDLPIEANLKSDWVNAFDGGSVSWSEVEQAFVGYFRWWDTKAEPKYADWMIVRPGVRTAFRSISKDLVTWSKPEPMTYGDTPAEHFYETCTAPYFRAPNLYIVLANRFNPGRRALTLEEERSLEITRFPGNKDTPTYTFASDANDLVLLTTKPGSSAFDRPFMEAFQRPGPELGNWASRCNYASLSGGVIPTGPAEISFYISRHHLQKTNYIQRISLRTDGFASVNAPYAGGGMVTVPFTYTGDHLVINYATSAAGEVKVELQDANGNPLPGFTFEDCDVLIGDRIDGPVSWHGQKSLARYIGKPVRLSFKLMDADIYSFRFPAAPTL
jgi:hypothetical protein